MADYKEELTKYEAIQADKITKGVDALSDIVNSMTFNYGGMSEKVVEMYLRTHRTLQQNTCRFIFTIIRKLAEYYEKNPDRYDLRNEGSKKWICDIAKVEAQFPYV